MTRGYYRRACGVASRVVDGEAFLIKMPENVLFVLNDAASRIWVRADGTRSGEELAGEWGRPSHGGREESQAFLDEMTERGLLLRSAEPKGKADVFPQEVTWPERGGSAEPPRIKDTEAVVASGGCDIAADPCEAPLLSGV